MRADWDARAELNAAFFVDFGAWRDEPTIEAAGRRDCAYLRAGLADTEWSRLTVLEIGCGIGRVLRPLAAACAHAVGVDVSRRMLAIARRRLLPASNVDLAVVAGTGQLPFVSGAFDVVLSCYVFEHVPSWVTWSYLREARRVLRPGGHLRFQMTAPFLTALPRIPAEPQRPAAVATPTQLAAIASEMLAATPPGVEPWTRGPTIEGDPIAADVMIAELERSGFTIERVEPTGANNYIVFARRGDDPFSPRDS